MILKRYIIPVVFVALITWILTTALIADSGRSISLEGLDSTAYSAAQLYPVLSHIPSSMLFTNWIEMVKYSKVAISTNGNMFSEYVSDPDVANNMLYTNENGSGGWCFNTLTKELSINITNVIYLRCYGQRIPLSDKFLLVSSNGTHIKFETKTDPKIGAHVEELIRKCNTLMELAEPENIAQ